MNDNTPEIDIDSDVETLSTCSPTSDLYSDTSSVVSCNTASSSSSGIFPPSNNEIPPPPPIPNKYYNRPKTVFVHDAINKKKKIIK